MKKTLMCLAILAAVLFGGVFMVCGAILGSVSILAGENLTTEYDIHETELYEMVVNLTGEYEQEMTKAIHDQAEQIREEHMEWVPHDVERTDPETGETHTTTVYRWECTVNVYETTYRINTTCFYAYISTTDQELLSGRKQKYMPTANAIKMVYDQICKLTVDESDDGKDFYVYNKVASSQDAKQVFFPDDELKQSFYQTSYDLFYGMIGDELDYEDGFLEDALENIDPNSMGIPLYLQYQSPWGSMAYGGGTIATSGCGPTCLAMVISYLKSESVLPSDIVAWAGNRFYVPGAGSSWGIYPAAAREWGISCRSVPKSVNSISAELSAGHPVIMSMAPGTFTRSGHFIVLSGIDDDGSVYVNDPNDSESKRFYERTFDLADILSEAKAAWSFY